MFKVNRVLIAISLVMILSLAGFCSITPEESSGKDYLRGHGYSKSTVQIVETHKSQVKGEAKRNNILKKSLLWLYSYIDVTKNTEKFGNFEIKD